MDTTNDISKIKDLLAKSTDVLVLTHENPTFDSMGSTLGLYLGLAGMGKKVTVACPDPVTVEHSNFVGANKLVTSLGNKNFVISLDYIDGSIEKVSYNIEGNKFNLVIEPRPGFDPFTQDKVHYSYAGAGAQLIFTVDTIHLGGLKKLYEEDKDLFTTKPIINIDRHPNNANYGHTNLVDMQASSTAEVVLTLLGGLGVAVTQDIATNLLNAVVSATNNFQNANTTVAAFELAAVAMKAGGKRFEKQGDQTPAGAVSLPSKEEVNAQTTEPPKEFVPQTPSVQQVPQQPKPQRTPPDWLKPKIFKSTNIS